MFVAQHVRTRARAGKNRHLVCENKIEEKRSDFVSDFVSVSSCQQQTFHLNKLLSGKIFIVTKTWKKQFFELSFFEARKSQIIWMCRFWSSSKASLSGKKTQENHFDLSRVRPFIVILASYTICHLFTILKKSFL